jgi:hypothetical protein
MTEFMKIFHEAWEENALDIARYFEWVSEARAEAGAGAVSLGYSLEGGHVHEAMNDAVRGTGAPRNGFALEEELVRARRLEREAADAATDYDDDDLPF